MVVFFILVLTDNLLKNKIATAPNIKPPIWAPYATPPPEEEEREELMNCRTNQKPKTNNAGILTIWEKNPSGMSTNTLALGWLTI